MKGTGPRPPPPPVEVLPETEATREQRQQIGEKALVALCSVLRNARSYSWEHDVFAAQLDALEQAMLELLGSDGTFELDLAGDAFHVNGQPVRLQPGAVPLAAALRTELRHRGITGLRASLAPPKNDLRLLLRLFRPAPPPRLDDRGDPARPFAVLRLRVGPEASSAGLTERTTRLAEAYAAAAAFVNQTIQQLRMGAPPLPVRTAGRIVQDLVGLLRAVKASPLLSARAILRDGDVSLAALERAQGAYECHLDLVPRDGPLPEIGLPGRILAICESFDALTTTRPFRAAHGLREATRIMTSEQLFRFDPQLVDLFVGVVARMLAATAPAG